MGKRVALLTLHGMGDEDRHYADALNASLEQRMGSDWQKISFQPVFYADVMQPFETAYWQKASAQFNFSSQLFGDSFKNLRQWVIYGFSDGPAQELRKDDPNDSYSKVQTCILQSLDAAFAELDPNRPLLVLAQSLGCRVISNYIWDANTASGAAGGIWAKNSPTAPPPAPPDQTAFRRMGNLRRMLTTGCNIPIFICGLQSPRAPRLVGRAFEWYNYFDKDDPLGWPLAMLGDYGFVQDIEVQCGGKSPLDLKGDLKGMTPAAHTQYWQNDRVLADLTQILTGCL